MRQTLVAENDDGGGGVNTRDSEFFPVRDDYYYVQVKNKGDIGGPNQMYDIQITVQPGRRCRPARPRRSSRPIRDHQPGPRRDTAPGADATPPGPPPGPRPNPVPQPARAHRYAVPTGADPGPPPPET